MKKWQIQSKEKIGEIIDILLENRGLKNKKEKQEFLAPTDPNEISLKDLGIDKKEVIKAIKRLSLAKKNKEEVIVYGDYDADGVCASAIMWEALHKFGLKVMPYIPDRFSEGYGVNAISLEKLKSQNPNLKVIITVDNGIVAYDAMKVAKKLGLDVIVNDHHTKEKKKLGAYAIIHTTKICGSAVAWIFTRELLGKRTAGLELAGIGTISDQMPLLEENRSFAKFGLQELRKTKREGIVNLCKLTQIDQTKIGTYEINFIIAPRINSMGRMGNAIDSLRLLCTKDGKKAEGLSQNLNKTNEERQRMLDEIVVHTRNEVKKNNWKSVIVVAHESYHEGIIGLAASRIVEEFYSPAIVISKGEKISKASARSISGFDIIGTIRMASDLILEGGGHPMAAGFSLETKKIPDFIEKLDEVSVSLLTEEILTRKLKIDMGISFNQINWELLKDLSIFDPVGIGNPAPLFVTYEVEISEARALGNGNKHLKLKLKKDDKFFDAIAFGFGEMAQKLTKGNKINVVYGVEENVWNGNRSIQLKVKDLKVGD